MVAPIAASTPQVVPSRKRKRQQAHADDADEMRTPAATIIERPSRTTPPTSFTPHKYETRTALHGRDETTHSKYDMRFHESLDRHTRPKYAARRHGNSQAKMPNGSESPMVNVKTSKAALVATPDADDDSDDDDSDDYDNNDADDDDDDNDDDDTEGGVVEREAPSSRKPDPRASRHSARSSAKKAIDYRMKRHPQDFAIPGYQHLTAARKAAPRSKLAARPKPKSQGRKSRAPDEDVLDLGTEPDDVDDLVEEAITKSIRSTPKAAATTIRTDRAPEGAPSQQHDTSENDPKSDSHIGIETKCKNDSGNEAKDGPEDRAARRTDVGPKTGPDVDSENSKQDCPNPNRLLSDGSKSSKSSKSSVTWPRGLPSLSERRCSSASGSMMSAWTEHETSEVWHDAQADTEHSRAASTIPGARAEARASSPAAAMTFNGLPEDTLSDSLAEVSSLQEVLEQDLATHEAGASLAASSDIWLNE